MALKALVVALGAVVASSAAASIQSDEPTSAPAGTAETRYCLHVAPITGTRIEDVQCWTRQQWADWDVDVDKEWAKEGVRVLSS
ncbi:MAG TPA: hypothetical protein VKC17_10580 [Sphingomicrobium sp.]|jgi:hypothetical protein|nr:hypothetical protein [Sphingomicrobium sp.]